MRTKKQIEKMMIGMLLGGGCLLSSCHSVHMSAEDRLQGDYQEAAAEVELETVEELTAFAYNDVSVIPYTVENIARGFTDLSDEEIEKYKVCDEHEIKSLTVPEENTKIQLDFAFMRLTRKMQGDIWISRNLNIRNDDFYCQSWQSVFRKKISISYREKK